MKLASIATLSGGGVVAMLATAGLAWHECVLFATAAATAHRLFLVRMDDGAPWDPWRVGVRSLCAGIVGLIVSLGLASLIGAGFAGAWTMLHEHDAKVVIMLTAAAFALVFARITPSGRADEAQFWSVLLGVVLVSFAGASAELPMLPCVAAASILVWLALSSWKLAHNHASHAFRCGQRM